MASSRKYAEIAAAALAKMLRDGADSGEVADIVERILADANREQQAQERKHVAEVEAAAASRLARLLAASPAVIYSFEAKGEPDLCQSQHRAAVRLCRQRISRRSNFWRERVHPDDLPRVEAEIGALFDEGQHVCELARVERRVVQQGTELWPDSAADRANIDFSH